ncbi:hypothetical protein IKF23_01785 [Candidatus Saccharibacteria bacterium]|nr:hypothetical protein [Candidatus Saccharibacteria bacterium]
MGIGMVFLSLLLIAIAGMSVFMIGRLLLFLISVLKDLGSTEDDTESANHPDLRERLKPYEDEARRFIVDCCYCYELYDDFVQFTNAAKSFRDTYNELVEVCNCGYQKISDVYLLENQFFDEYKKIIVPMMVSYNEDEDHIKEIIITLGEIVKQMKDFLRSLPTEEPLGESNEVLLDESDKYTLEKIIKEHESKEVKDLGNEILRLYIDWTQAIKSGVVDEFSETRKTLDGLTERLSDFANGQYDYGLIVRQLEKARKNINLLQEIVKARMENSSETIGDELNLDSWNTVLENTLRQEQIS